MRRHIALAAAGAASFAGAAMAQGETAGSIDPNLRCAIWAAVAGGEFEQGPARATYDSVFTYFMGKFEGGTGERLDMAMTPQVVITVVEDWIPVTAACELEALDLGERLADLGAHLHKAPDGAGDGNPREEPSTSVP